MRKFLAKIDCTVHLAMLRVIWTGEIKAVEYKAEETTAINKILLSVICVGKILKEIGKVFND